MQVVYREKCARIRVAKFLCVHVLGPLGDSSVCMHTFIYTYIQPEVSCTASVGLAQIRLAPIRTKNNRWPLAVFRAFL